MLSLSGVLCAEWSSQIQKDQLQEHRYEVSARQSCCLNTKASTLDDTGSAGSAIFDRRTILRSP